MAPGLLSDAEHRAPSTSGKAAHQDEPLLTENPERFCMFPIKYQDIWRMYKQAESSFWTGKPVCRSCGALPRRPAPGTSSVLTSPSGLPRPMGNRPSILTALKRNNATFDTASIAAAPARLGR